MDRLLLAGRLHAEGRRSTHGHATRSDPVEGPLVLYRAGIHGGKYRKDPRQEATITKLQDLYNRLLRRIPRPPSGGGLAIVDAVHQSPKKSTSWWQRMVGDEDGHHSSNHGHQESEKIVQGEHHWLACQGARRPRTPSPT